MVGGCRLWVFGWNADIVCLFIPHKYQQTTKQPITNKQLNHKTTKPQNNQKPITKNHGKEKTNRRMRA